MSTRLGKVISTGDESCWYCGLPWSRPRTTDLTSPRCACMATELCDTCKRCVAHCEGHVEDLKPNSRVFTALLHPTSPLETDFCASQGFL